MVGDDDAWLADDEGNLRPGVADALRGRGRARPRRPARDPAPAFPNAVHLGLGACGFLLLMTMVCTAVTCPGPSVEPSVPDGVLLADGVLLRSGPGPEYPPRGRLEQYASVQVKQAKDGWYRVRAGGRTAWVYGGYVLWPSGDWHGPGLVMKTFSFGDHGRTRTVKKGTLLLIEKMRRDGSAVVVLPDRTRVHVDPGTVEETGY